MMRARILGSSSTRSDGKSIVIGCPIASAAVYPNILSAPRFQEVMMPPRSLLRIASLEEFTSDAKKASVGGILGMPFGTYT
jgi:hypothetical protein